MSCTAPTRRPFARRLAANVARCALSILCALFMLVIPAGSTFAQFPQLHQALQDTVRAVSEATQAPPQDGESQRRSAETSPALGEAASDEPLPAPHLEGQLPLADAGDGEVQLSESKDGRITLIVRDASLSRVLALLAQTHNLNIVAANDIDALISITLRDVPLEEALSAILSVANYTWVEKNNIILITSLMDAGNLPADVQGRQIQVFDLDFASAAKVAESVSNFLSPIGKVTIAESSPTNNRLTQERVVVEDTPESLARIADFICQVDRPPRQVQIEAHILQINLDDTCRCGVNLDQLIRFSNFNNLSLATTGFADPDAPQAFLATLEGGNLGGVIEALQTTTDSKTLGSPKLLVLNEQEARMQVGQQLGFRVTTTTETSTMEGVQMLDVGVVLTVRPRITRDGRVLLHVKPEVSKGEVNPETGLPEEETTEVETSIMLNDGQGMIIGGLIQELDSTVQSKVPYLGEVKGVGWLFRKSEITKQRVEIIVALVPRIQPYDCEWEKYEQGQFTRASVELFNGPLNRNARPWEPILPDGKRIKRPLIPTKKHWKIVPPYPENSWDYDVPPTPLPKQHALDCEACDACAAGPEGLYPTEASVRTRPLPTMNPSEEEIPHVEIISDEKIQKQNFSRSFRELTNE